MKIAKDCIVGIRYQLISSAGEVLDESPEGEPLVYLHGAAGVLPALENALAGKSTGDSFDVTVTPEQGFGEHQPTLIEQVNRSAFPASVNVEVGLQFKAQNEQGERLVTVTAVTDDFVTVDGNHPLAGMTLRFKGEIIDVRQATEAEVQHWPNPVPAN